MNSEKVLYAIYLLINSTTDKDKQLEELYKKILDNDEDYNSLLQLIKDINCYGDRGKELISGSVELLEAARNDAANIYNIMDQIRKMSSDIKEHISVSDSLIRSKNNLEDVISVVYKSDCDLYNEVLDAIIKALKYIILISGEYDNLNGLINPIDIPSKFTFIYNDCFNIISNGNTELYAWYIKKEKLNWEVKLADYEYVLYRISINEYFDMIDSEEFIQLNTNLFYNLDADSIDLFEVPIYLGLGFIISCNIDGVDTFLNNNFSVSLNSVSDEFMGNKCIRIDDLILKLCSTNNYIINPIDVIGKMNEWAMEYYLKNRLENHKCIFCGKQLSYNGKICKDHINL